MVRVMLFVSSRGRDSLGPPVGIKQYGKFWYMVEASVNTMGCRRLLRFRPSMAGCKQELVRRGVPDEAHVDDHRGRRRAGQLEMVPGAFRSSRYPSCP